MMFVVVVVVVHENGDISCLLVSDEAMRWTEEVDVDVEGEGEGGEEGGKRN